jgi:hypothetical protein
MTVGDDVLRALRARPTGMSDTEPAAMLHKRHQHINQTCRTFASQGLITGDSSYDGIVNRVAGDVSAPRVPATQQAAHIAGEQEWAREGNVRSRVAAHLAPRGWSIIRVADTAQRERGANIIAGRDSQRLLVEIKGWPSSIYARDERAGQPRPTQPTLQASHWFAEALACLIRPGTEPGSQLAMGLPDIPRHRTLLGETGWALNQLDIAVYLATAEGAVEIWEREN